MELDKEQVIYSLRKLESYIDRMDEEAYEMFKGGQPAYSAMLPSLWNTPVDSYEPDVNIKPYKLMIRLS